MFIGQNKITTEKSFSKSFSRLQMGIQWYTDLFIHIIIIFKWSVL